jgi:tRNA G18 (ribose-2'-O)-methylase SpoU
MSTMRLKLPMKGRAESLNAAAAATVMMYDFLRIWEERV